MVTSCSKRGEELAVSRRCSGVDPSGNLGLGLVLDLRLSSGLELGLVLRLRLGLVLELPVINTATLGPPAT